MKARKETPKPLKNDLYSAEELKRAKKLKPVKKEKNQKKTLFQEIDEFEDLDMDYKSPVFDDDLYGEDNEDDEDDSF